MSKEKIIFHGSHKIIEHPAYGVGSPNNDYGLGFYCTEYVDLAKEWACDQLSGGYANKYSIDISGLKILNLNSKEYNIIHWVSVLLKNRKVTLTSDIEQEGNSKEYNIIHWVSVLLKNRKVTLTSDIEQEGMYYILDNFPVDTESYDVIIGYRADDSYFSYARDFLSNTITVKRLTQVMRLGNLGNQIVIKSKLAFSRLQFLGYEVAPQGIHYPLRKKRDELARSAYLSNRKGCALSSESLLLIDIIRGGIRPDDPRLQ